MTTTTTPVRITVEARIWAVSDHGTGPRVKLYCGSSYQRIDWHHTRVPLTDGDRTTWFQITLENNEIVGVTI